MYVSVTREMAIRGVFLLAFSVNLKSNYAKTNNVKLMKFLGFSELMQPRFCDNVDISIYQLPI